MFRERIAHWAKVLDLLTVAADGVAVLAAFRASALLPRVSRLQRNQPLSGIDPRTNMAIAYMQVSRLNR
jgi:hypothetical protein